LLSNHPRKACSKTSSDRTETHPPDDEKRVDHHPETDVVVPIVWIVPVPVGAAGEPARVVDGTAALHAQVTSAQVLPPIISLVWVFLILAARPLPDIARHIQRAVGAGASRKAAHRAGAADAGFVRIGFARVKIIPPGINPPIGAACCFLPLSLAGQGRLQPSRGYPFPEVFLSPVIASVQQPLLADRCQFASQPAAVFHCVKPGYINDRMIRHRIPLPPIEFITLLVNEKPELRHGHRVAGNVKRSQINLMLIFFVINSLFICFRVAAHTKYSLRDFNKTQG